VKFSGDAGSDDARRVWISMIDRRPAVIVRRAADTDVAYAISFARQHDLEMMNHLLNRRESVVSVVPLDGFEEITYFLFVVSECEGRLHRIATPRGLLERS